MKSSQAQVPDIYFFHEFAGCAPQLYDVVTIVSFFWSPALSLSTIDPCSTMRAPPCAIVDSVAWCSFQLQSPGTSKRVCWITWCCSQNGRASLRNKHIHSFSLKKTKPSTTCPLSVVRLKLRVLSAVFEVYINSGRIVVLVLNMFMKDNVGKTIINHPLGKGLYHPFMVVTGVWFMASLYPHYIESLGSWPTWYNAVSCTCKVGL